MLLYFFHFPVKKLLKSQKNPFFLMENHKKINIQYLYIFYKEKKSIIKLF